MELSISTILNKITNAYTFSLSNSTLRNLSYRYIFYKFGIINVQDYSLQYCSNHRRLETTHMLVKEGLCIMEDIHIMEYNATMQKSGEVLCNDIERSLRYIAKCKKRHTDGNSANYSSFYVVKRRKNKNLYSCFYRQILEGFIRN